MRKPITLFGPDLGGPANHYRIPSLICTKNGVLVACADARIAGGYDNPNRIDKVVRRSLDGGLTWSDFILVHREQGETRDGSSAAIDPVMVYVPEQGRIYMLYCHTPAGIGLYKSVVSRGEDEEGRRYVFRGNEEFRLIKDGRLVSLAGEPTPYCIHENGDVVEGEKVRGNIYTRTVFEEAPTSYLMICHSDDDGLTWSKPYSLNNQVKEEYMSFIGPGPGIGIVKQHEPHKGRILVPIYYGTQEKAFRLSCCVIYSDDGGITWTRGESPNNLRLHNGERLSDLTITEEQALTESQLIEQEDGTLKYFMRNHDPRHSTAICYSHDGGATWQDFDWDDALPQPICQLAVLKLRSVQGQPSRVVFLNAASRTERACGTLRLSEDDGETFPYSCVICPGEFVYSCMAELPGGQIAILYEPTNDCTHIDFTVISPDEIK